MTRAPAAADARPARRPDHVRRHHPLRHPRRRASSTTATALVFHATGTGGRAMEGLADSGMLEGLIDVTTTEVADHLFGGVLSAGPDRLGAVARTRHPLRRLLRRPRHGQLLGARDRPRPLRPPPALPPQPERHADAHHRRGVPRDRRLDRREAQRLPRAGPLPDPRARRLRPRRRRRRLPRPGRPTPRSSTRSKPASSRPPTAASPGCPSTSTTRRSPTPSSPPTGRSPEAPCPPSPAPRSSPGSTAMVADGEPIIGGGAGTGLSAKCEEAGGIDLIVIYNSGRYRMAGRGSAAGLLAYGNANAIVKEMAAEVLPVVRHTPGPRRRQRHRPLPADGPVPRRAEGDGLLRRAELPDRRPLRRHHARASFEETGMGYGLEVEMIAAAHALDLLTTPYVFDPDEAVAMTRAGADVIVAHMGVTTGGAIGATSAQLARRLRRRRSTPSPPPPAATRADVIVLCHGGPIAEPADAALRPRACRRLPRLLRRLLDGAPAGRARRSPTRPAPSRRSAKPEETPCPASS